MTPEQLLQLSKLLDLYALKEQERLGWNGKRWYYDHGCSVCGGVAAMKNAIDQDLKEALNAHR